MAAIDIPLVLDDTTKAEVPKNKPPLRDAEPTLKPHPHPLPLSPARGTPSSAMASSPGLLRSPSPRLHSPASSEIFERSVQEPVPMSTLAGEPSAHLPAHVMTEDHIPPALEASVQAITSQSLNADEVEIVTSTSHQPAGSQLEASTSQLDVSTMGSTYSLQRPEETDSQLSQSGLVPGAGDEETGSTYGSIDPNDLRRLSFISYADVVHSEHQHPAPAMMNDGSANSPPLSSSIPRSQPPRSSASPLHTARSPASSISVSQTAGAATPPLVAARAIMGSEAGLTPHSGSHGELTVETLRQAVRKTASGDIGQSFRSPALSPASTNDDTGAARGRTNT